MDEECAKGDTTTAVLGRMKETESRMTLLLDRIKKNPRDLSKWNIDTEKGDGADKDKDGTNPPLTYSFAIRQNKEEMEKRNSQQGFGESGGNDNDGEDNKEDVVATVMRKILSDFSRKLDQSRSDLMASYHHHHHHHHSAATPKKEGDDEQQEKGSDDEEKKKLRPPPPQPISIQEVEHFLFSHSEWQSLPGYCAEMYFAAFRSIMDDVGPLIPPSFVEKNKMLPKPLGKNELPYRFVREGGIADKIFACCSVDDSTLYQNALSDYNSSFVRSLLLPAELFVTEQDSRESAQQKKFSLPSAIVSRGRCLLEAMKRRWLPVSVLKPLAIENLEAFSEHCCSGSGGGSVEPTTGEGLTTSSNHKAAFAKLIQDFTNFSPASDSASSGTAVKGRLTLVPAASGDDNNSSNNNNSDGSAVGGDDDDNREQQQQDDVWKLYETFIHLIVTGHFHCSALVERMYPRQLSASPVIVIGKVKRVVWNIRKNIAATACLLWSDYAASMIDRLIDEVSTSSLIAITGGGGGDHHNSLKIKVCEAPAPIRPKGPELEDVLNRFLDGFVDRYKEMIAAAVRLSRDGGGANSITTEDHLATRTSSSFSSSSSSPSASAGSVFSPRNGTTGNNKSSSSSSEQQQKKPCCGYCTRGLTPLLRRIIPENGEAQLIKTLQSRLRQKLIVAFVCNDEDKEIVRGMLSDVAAKVWQLSVGGEYSDAEKKFAKEDEDGTKLESPTSLLLAKKNSGGNDHDDVVVGATFSPVSGDEEGGGGGPATAATTDETNKTSIKKTRLVVVDDPPSIVDADAKASVAYTLDRAKSRVVLHAAAEMTRVTDALSEVIVSQRCPETLKLFAGKIVKGSQNAVHVHITAQAQALLTAKEVVRHAERICELGSALGGPLASGLSRSTAPVIELQRVLDQMQALMKKFPRSESENQPTGLEWDSSDVDADNNNSSGGGGGNLSAVDSFGGFGNQTSTGNDDLPLPFVQIGAVLPLYKMKQSWDRYNAMVQSASS